MAQIDHFPPKVLDRILLFRGQQRQPATARLLLLQTGDLLFTHYDAGVRHGYLEPLSEIYWAYDRYCTPTAPGQIIPVYPNVFGQFLSGSEDFFAASRRLHLEGAARLVVTGEEGC